MWFVIVNGLHKYDIMFVNHCASVILTIPLTHDIKTLGHGIETFIMSFERVIHVAKHK
jgi:hypothetical protein